MVTNVETMFYVHERPWHGPDAEVQEALNSVDALKIAGLDWEVRQRNIQICGGVKIGNYKANVRGTDGRILDVVSDRYRIVQNKDAFSLTDELIGGNIRYETAGSLRNDKKIWLLAKMSEREAVGDKVEPYLCFSNMHNGGSSIRIYMTSIRVVCNNTLSLALSSVERQQATKHVGNIDGRMQEARTCLQLADAYMDELVVCVDRLANTTITDEQLDKLLSEMFPIDDDGTECGKNSVEKAKDEFTVCYFRPNIMKFLDTGWDVVNAMSDMTSHSAPHRQTGGHRENNWNRIMDGHKMLGRMTELVYTRQTAIGSRLFGRFFLQRGVI